MKIKTVEGEWLFKDEFVTCGGVRLDIDGISSGLKFKRPGLVGDLLG